MAGTIHLSITYTTTAAGNQTIAPTDISISVPDGTVTNTVLASGANNITVPSTTTLGVFIQPPLTNTVALTLKGVTGDTGVALSKTNWNWVALNAAALPATICVTAASATSGATTFIFI